MRDVEGVEAVEHLVSFSVGLTACGEALNTWVGSGAGIFLDWILVVDWKRIYVGFWDCGISVGGSGYGGKVSGLVARGSNHPPPRGFRA